VGVYNEIQVGRFNRLIQKLLSMKGRATMNIMSPELQAVLPLFHGPEDRYLEGWNEFGHGGQVVAPGGAIAAKRLRNPVGSNALILVTKVSFGNVLADQPFINRFFTSLDLNNNPFTGALYDIRTGQAAASVGIISTQTGAAGSPGATIWQGVIPANGYIEAFNEEDQFFPILPGDSLSIYSNAVTQSPFITMMWRERFLEDSERT